MASLAMGSQDATAARSSSLSVEKPEPEPELALPASPPPESTDSSTEFNPTLRFKLAFVALAIITLAAALDATSLSVALPIITDAIGGTAIEAFWAGTSFLLTSTVFQPSFASMSHIFGRKPLLYIAMTLFAAGSLMAALSSNFTMMLVGRSIQGVGGGGVITLTEIVITDLVPLRFRGAWFGYISAMWAVGSVGGPLVGGALSQNGAWRWIFYLNLPVIGFGAILITIFLKLNFVVGSFGEKLRRFDWIGAFLGISSTTSLLIPITWGGVSYPWDSWHTLVPLIIGAAGIVAFAFYERYGAVEPLMPSTIFANRTLRIAYAVTVLHGMILWSLLYYMPLFYEAVKGYTPIVTGVALFPATFTVAPASVVVGIIVTITGHYRWALWVGWILTTAGMGLLYLMTPEISIPAFIFVNLVSGLGLGLLFPSMAFSIQAAIEPKDIAFGVAFFSFFRAFGQGIGIAVGGVTFQNQVREKILTYPLIAPFADQYSQDATALVGIINSMPEGEARDNLVHAYADAIKVIWIVMCAIAGAAMIASFFMKSYSLDQVLQTAQGFDGNKKEKDEEKGAAADKEESSCGN